VIKQVTGKDVGELALSPFDSDARESEIRSAAFTPTPVASDPEAEVHRRRRPPIDIAPGEKPAELTPRPDALIFLGRMDEAQKALLLSTLGLVSKPVENPAPDVAVSNAIPHANKTNTLIPHTATVSATAFSAGDKSD